MVRLHIPGPWDRSLRTRLVGDVRAALGGHRRGRRASSSTGGRRSRPDDIGLRAARRRSPRSRRTRLDRWIDEQRRNVVFVGSIPGVGDQARDMLDPKRRRPAIVQAAREDSSMTSSRSSSSRPPMPRSSCSWTSMGRSGSRPSRTTRGRQPGGGAFLHETGSSHTTVQNAYRSTLTGAPTITISSPLFDANGRGPTGRGAGRQPQPRADRPDRPRDHRPRRGRGRPTSSASITGFSTPGWIRAHSPRA